MIRRHGFAVNRRRYSGTGPELTPAAVSALAEARLQVYP